MEAHPPHMTFRPHHIDFSFCNIMFAILNFSLLLIVLFLILFALFFISDLCFFIYSFFYSCRFFSILEVTCSEKPFLRQLLQSAKILLLPPKYELIMVPSNHSKSIAPCKDITPNPLCIPFCISSLLLFWWLSLSKVIALPTIAVVTFFTVKLFLRIWGPPIRFFVNKNA